MGTSVALTVAGFSHERRIEDANSQNRPWSRAAKRPSTWGSNSQFVEYALMPDASRAERTTLPTRGRAAGILGIHLELETINLGLQFSLLRLELLFGLSVDASDLRFTRGFLCHRVDLGHH